MKITLECEHKNISECKDCPISIFNKYNKLLDFVKDQARFINSSNSFYYALGVETSEFLHDLGELNE